jgi:hypothetical protein
MSLQVIGVGFGRTGTLSLKVALEQLGFAPCEHMFNLLADPTRVAQWLEAARRKEAGEPIDWEALLGHYRATVDWPGVFFWRELVASFLDAKVVLTMRDPDRWYASAGETILRLNEPRDADGSPLPLAPEVVARRKVMDPLLNAVLFKGMFHGRVADHEYATGVFAQHIADVKAEVAAERLLIYEVKEGWGPLCRFLGLAEPVGEPFPHLNEAAAFRAGVNRFSPAAPGKAAS